ncbi:MAG TPA: DUF4097 family beta strand repeat-containing protein [Gemmatimonadaceae bacterium]|jgi:DUF4097 and DUF4098 domain-containing protein YvlB|nr:DUF4097 family beta strand repeat-containing protein [Gemmatimonadaceae bacterium]
MENHLKLGHVALAAAATMIFSVAASAQDYQLRTQIDTTVRLDRGGTVDLSLISGKIRVTGWDRPDVKITASIESGELRFDANPSRVSLSVEDNDRSGRRRHNNDVGEARYEVSVPRGAKLILEAVSGDITATGSQGEIEANSVSGDVEVANGVREVSAEAVSGSVRVSQVNGNLRAETVSGDVRAESVTGDIEGSSVSGNVRIVGARSKDVRTETVSGDITYTGTIDSGGRYSYESHSGGIRLNIPRSTGAQFSVETFSGDLSADFPIQVRAGGSRKEGHMEFTLGDGGARVTLETFSGRVVIDTGTDSTTRRDDE